MTQKDLKKQKVSIITKDHEGTRTCHHHDTRSRTPRLVLPPLSRLYQKVLYQIFCGSETCRSTSILSFTTFKSITYHHYVSKNAHGRCRGFPTDDSARSAESGGRCHQNETGRIAAGAATTTSSGTAIATTSCLCS